ncbi:hypothetical protein D8674_000754 [Pyrus ussuriensis x Pyrus communis]|uniref:Uncharacterized protein n=1 Tax=Pyrus ussuriensis x Pyrus communis TaxID=2448454 RepID=A0A5N5FHH2_9ROSA|nr:hypothetical protein D8674_000754 [Pyrus ussuriensis x Pyrus communis]
MAVSSANSHENINLELPMAWEPSESSGATRSRQAARSHFGISVGDECQVLRLVVLRVLIIGDSRDCMTILSLRQIWSWNLLRNLANKASINRMVGGDFNELIHIHEKWEVTTHHGGTKDRLDRAEATADVQRVIFILGDFDKVASTLIAYERALGQRLNLQKRQKKLRLILFWLHQGNDYKVGRGDFLVRLVKNSLSNLWPFQLIL